jgi:hypothetical protein
MMRWLRLEILTGVPVEEPTASGGGFVTWFEVKIVIAEDEEPDDEEAPASVEVEVGKARLTHVHVGAVRESPDRLKDVLECQGLEELYATYFDEEHFIEDFEHAPGVGLMYLDELTVHPRWLGHNIELAVVYRLCQTIAEGCKVFALRSASAEEEAQWTRLGFEPSIFEPSTHRTNLLHLTVGYPYARVYEGPDDDFRFTVEPLEEEGDHRADAAEDNDTAASSAPGGGASPSTPSPTSTPAPRRGVGRRRGAPRRR